MGERTLPDQAARDRIAQDLDRTMLVEAAAGTGKTTCLVTRLVGLLRQGKCRVETLAAVTFTRKAAAELRSRFRIALERALAEAERREPSGVSTHADPTPGGSRRTATSPGTEQARLAEALEHVERCFVGTIHSFCARLLRERPVEAGVDPGFVELDEELDHHLRRQAWREQVATLIATDDPVLPELEKLGLKISAETRHSSAVVTELDELGLEPAELGPAFLKLAEYPDVDEWPAESVPMPDLAPYVAALQEYVAHMRAVPLPAEHGSDRLIPKFKLIARMCRRRDLTQTSQLMEVYDQFREFTTKAVTYEKWPGKKKQAIDEQDHWNDFVRRYALPLQRAWREHRYEPVMRAICPARAVYDRLRRERNALNFQDLLLRAAHLLREPDVRRYFRERFTHVLVDEFQDTDPIQAEVMLLLTADDVAEPDWRRCRPVPGSLFVVGDPKQSIYRFRRADIVTYGKVRSIIEATGGEVISLSTNFRSRPPVVDWVNACFAQLFPATSDDYSPANRPLDVGRADLPDRQVAGVEKLVISAATKAVREFEADLIARTIRRAIDEPGRPESIRPGDFLIVTRNKKNLADYARALERYGVPHVVTGGSQLNQVPELTLLHACLTAVVRSDDPIALVAVLRSELFGIADTVLYDYRRLDGRFTYHAEIPAELPAADAAELREAFGRLQTYARWLRRMTPAAAIERMAADLGLIARAAAAEDGDARAGGLLKAIELLRAADSLTAGDAVETLARLVKRDETHDGVPVRPSTEPPVRVMNLHKCKGLEAPFVFLVDPTGDKEHAVECFIDRSGSHLAPRDVPFANQRRYHEAHLAERDGYIDRSLALGSDEPRVRGYLAILGPRRSEHGPQVVLAQPRGWDEWAAEEQRFLDAEENRLLYVAATRAGSKLVISQWEAKENGTSPWRTFDEFLDTAAPFDDPGPIAPNAATPATFDSVAWEKEIAAIESRWQAVVPPTYAVRAIKALVLSNRPKPHGAEPGGAEWGEVIHTLLEALMQRPTADLHRLARTALEKEELSVTLVDEVLEAVQRVTTSDLWHRARSASQFFTEVPLARPLPADESPDGVPTVLRGVLDLVFREGGGWVIADYKSERVDSSAIPALVSYYRPQLFAYATAWEQLVGEPVVECGLFFTHTGEYRTVK